MHTKLTLRLEDDLVEKAKAWAKVRQVSLSQVVAEFFAQLPEEGGATTQLRLSPWTRRLSKAVEGKVTDRTDEQIRDEYLDYLEAKHK